MQEDLFNHFNRNRHDGFLKNVSTILKTYAPFGLNIEDSV